MGWREGWLWVLSHLSCLLQLVCYSHVFHRYIIKFRIQVTPFGHTKCIVCVSVQRVMNALSPNDGTQLHVNRSGKNQLYVCSLVVDNHSLTQDNATVMLL